jgi:hypothetical protein
MSDFIIPLENAGNLKAAAKYILKNKCDSNPSGEETASYEVAMEYKGIKTPQDLKRKDPRWWPALRQKWSGMVLVAESALPSCPAKAKEEKPQAAIPASKPVVETKTVEPKKELKIMPAPAKKKIEHRAPVKKEERKTIIP